LSKIYRSVDTKESFPELEERILKRWADLRVFEKSLSQREGSQEWVFYEGPPTANGKPGSHHVLSRVFKDIFPRYKTMQGFHVARKGGWDCHGLPVELGVEKELGINSKEEIEKYGIAEFNAKCRDSVFTYLEEWNKLTERIGFWIDLDDAYRTLDNDYIESVWWALKQIWSKQSLYEGHKVVPYCPRCGTALSSHEVALGYKDLTDQSVYVKLPVTSAPDGSPVQEGDQLLVWTTTPWTLPSNVAVAVNPEIVYVRVQLPDGQGTAVLAKELIGNVFEEQAEAVEVLATFDGSQLTGVQYEPAFNWLEQGGKRFQVDAEKFVTASDGTGLVHIAPPFGEDDYRFGREHGYFETATDLEQITTVRSDGTYDASKGVPQEYLGRFVKELDLDLIGDLKSRGRVLRKQAYKHSYPHCWRCDTPLLYYAKPSWYIKTQQIRERMQELNQEVDWQPEHIRDGRFGNWLESNIDWAISRERYWGTPLPLWRCTDDLTHVHCVGSFNELEELSGKKIDDPHRPYVDDVTFECQEDGCSGTAQRVPEVVDVWFDSGAMPFAQHHAPFENNELFKHRFPADFICEAIDQTRGWFYSLLAVSTLVFDTPAYKNVICLGLILDQESQKMSKSRGNVVEPWDVIDQHGADAMRWYYLTSKQPWDGYRFSVEAVSESVRQFLLQLWNTYGFYVLYGNINAVEKLSVKDTDLEELDRWVLSRLATVTEEVTERLDSYDATFAGRTIQVFVDDLSNWYVRRSRRRFWDGDPAAFATLRHCLVTVSKLLAPFTPFLSDEIYTELADEGKESVHLCDFPQTSNVGAIDSELEFAMAIARETVKLGLAARGQAKMKVRQPLSKAVVVAEGREKEAIENLTEIICEELNVKQLQFVAAADELGEYELKPNYRGLGPRFGSDMPKVAQAVSKLDPAEVSLQLKDDQPVAIEVDGESHWLSGDDLQLKLKPLDGYQLESQSQHAVALDLSISEELRLEGLARETVHAVQGLRKEENLEVEDRIKLYIDGSSDILRAIEDNLNYVESETLSTETILGSLPSGVNQRRFEIDDDHLDAYLVKQ